jgi:hypothetical protein
MKKGVSIYFYNSLTLLIIVFVPHLCFAQSQKEPVYYLNNEPCNMDSTFLYLKNIESLNVKKDKTDGEIFITTKTQPWEYYRLNDLLKGTTLFSQIYDSSVIPVFIIEGKVINNEYKAKIDKSYYTVVTLGRLSNVTGLSGESKRIVIVNISLTDKDPKKDIRIRGDSIPNLN